MRQTPLNGLHKELGGRMVDFAGWEMPVVYSSIIEEHQHTRRHASFFDVSHMGRVEFRGPDAGALLERLNTRRIGDMTPGQCRYSHMCREDGGILDDVIVNRRDQDFLVVCNASNREKLLAWWERQAAGMAVELRDTTFETAMVAIQGPKAIPTLEALLPFQIGDLKRYHFRTGELFGAQYLIARTGYTGEDGVEIILPAHLAAPAMNMLISRSAAMDAPIKPAGLGARDTLRTEAAMPLYGHELSEEWDPITAGQGWIVHLDKDFIGKPAIEKVKVAGPRKTLVGIDVDSKRTPRQGAVILAGGGEVGAVTSAVSSPTLGRVIAMGFVAPEHAQVAAPLEIDLKTSKLAARVAPLPFYKRGA